MTTVTCDLCGRELDYNHLAVKVEFLDGEHPHCGSTMHRTADCCPDCIRRLPELSCNMEFDDARQKLKR